ncbi:MAG: hypothetical protein K2X71_12455 [Methylobacterium sp.]|uniref:hypothetical protein n=1 Tax=Methylobacterium sp. TaxID=409 RepID=UPI00258BE119|nr:hypothetical protein [Methylobacterium sp.]MBY0296832.1 hypothetical protein [Methylobacterium sp.]
MVPPLRPADPSLCQVREIADGISLDIAAAVLASPYATEILAREGAPDAQRRMAVRTAILLALPA